MAKKEADTKELLVPANASERQAIRNNILLSRLLAVGLLVFFGREAYYQMVPNVIKEPVYIEFRSSTNNFVKIARAGESIAANKALIEASIRRYLVDRERVDKVTEPIRYQRVMAMSAKAVGEEFRIKYGDEEAPFKTPGHKRDISIDRAEELVPGIYQVEYTITDTFGEAQRSHTTDKETASGDTSRHRYHDKPPSTAQWVATIQYQLREQNVTYDKRLMNPLGLYITNFSLTRRKQ